MHKLYIRVQRYSISVEVEVNDTLVVVDGSFEIDVYCEDDYFNGTGWVTTYISVIVEIFFFKQKTAYEIETTYDLAEIERSVENDLAA